MGHDQIVAILLEGELPQICLHEVDLGPCAQPRARERDHARARFEAIDLRPGMHPNELCQKTPIPFADDQHPARRWEVANERQPRLLELIAKNEPLERAIKGRDPIETHRSKKGSASKGVSKTRSARAVR